MMKIIKNNLNKIYINSKSKFLGFSFYVDKIEQVNNYLKDIKDKYRNATHICYAYILNKDQSVQKYNDDNEPSGSSGYVILNLLIKKQITNILIVVVRYFGGTKLGLANLIKSYLCITELVLNNNLIDYIEYRKYSLVFDYNSIKTIDYFIKKNNIEIIEKKFTNNIEYIVKSPIKINSLTNIKINELT